MELFYEIFNIAIEGSWDVASGITDAVVGNSVLRKIIGADFFTAVTGADEGFSGSAGTGVFFVYFGLQ